MGLRLHKLSSRRAILAGLCLVVGAAFWILTPESVSQRPIFSPEDCRRLAFVDESGAAIVGAEDLAIDRAAGRLFISAYDRRHAERAAARGDREIIEGGVYEISTRALKSLANQKEDGPPLALRDVLASDRVEGGLRPHGLVYDDRAGELLVINRGYHRISGRWRRRTTLLSIGAELGVLTAQRAVHCAANDVLLLDGRGPYVTADHGACGWRAAIEDVFGLPGSGLADGDQIVKGGFRFANGAVRSRDGDVYVAATREDALHALPEDWAKGGVDAKGASLQRLKLPGGPDNLTLDVGSGALVAALHPSLLRLAFHRKLGIGRAPSRIVSIDPKTGAWRLLFDDRRGAVFSAATVGLVVDEYLVIGSATDAGLLVCRDEAAS